MKLNITLYLITCLVLQMVNAQPTINSFAPIASKPGDAVVITGTNFSTTTVNNIVFFGAAQATVTAATATNLTVTVPIGATYAPITVLNTSSGLMAYSVLQFNPIYSPAKTGITTADFAAKQDFATGAIARSVAVGDMDGDGKVDMIVTNQSSNTISIFSNTSTSSTINFAAKTDFVTGTTPYGLCVADINGDGKLDIVVTNLNSNSISAFKNISTSGNINFAAKVDVTVGTNPRSISCGDVDGDGKVDVAVANSNAASVSVLRNTSTSSTISFATAVSMATGSFPVSVAIGDIDGDTKADIVTTNQFGENISVLLNTSSTGNISFASKVDYASSTGPFSVAIVDLNGDNKNDIAVAVLNSNQVAVFRNTSTIGSISLATRVNFASGTSVASLSVGDFDGDGKPDIATANSGSTANSTSILRNTSTATTISFATKVDVSTGTGPSSVAVGDFNSDGRLDIVTANSGPNVNTVSVLRNVFVPSNNANLSALAIGTGTLVPVFNSATTSYNVSVPNTTASFSVTPTVSETNATIQVNFNNGSFTTLTSGSTSSNYLLNVGSNSINVKVTAQDGTTIKTYTIFITRATSNDANLSALTMSVGTLSPVFDANTTVYTTTVLSSSSVVTVTPTSNEPNATIRLNVNGGTYFATNNGSPSTGLVLNNGNNTINVLVTAQDGTTTKTYNITVNKPTNVADLFALTISTGTLSPTFVGGIINYTVSLPNGTSGITVRPTIAVNGATIRVNINGGSFSVVNNGANSATLPLNIGANTINIQVTAADGVTVKTYTIVVTRALSNNANLSNITLSTGFLSGPMFSPNTTSYTSIQQNGTTSITFTPTSTDAGATLQYRVNAGTFIAINNGTASAAIPLSLGSNIIEILVTAQDGITTKTYTVDIIRANNNANLSNVTTSAGSLSPVFSANTTEYVVNTILSNGVNSVTITPTLADTNGTIRVRSWSGIVGAGEPTGTASFTTPSGAISLPLLLVGNSTVIEIRVTAQDGTTSKVYNIRVVRSLNNNANLTALSLTVGTISPVFSTNTTAYTANVTNTTTSVRVNFTREIFNSVVNIRQSGGGYTSYALTGGGGSQQSNQFNLNIGSNQIELLVVAQDGITTKLYTINIIRAGSPNPDLSNLVLSVGTLSPSFSTGNISYTATVPATISFMAFTATAVDASTTIKYGMNGTIDQPVVSGSQSPSLQLNISQGLNLLQITVSNGGNLPAKTYTVRITRLGHGPTISSFTPLSAKPGDIVTINGTNFRDANINDNIVYFGATKATLTAVTSTQITAIVPSGATYAPITVLNASPALSGTSTQKFNPIYAPAKTSITSGDFAARVNYDVNRRRLTSVAVGDIDGDGKPDMAATAYYEVLPVLTVFRNTSTSGGVSFAPRMEISTAETPIFVTMGDIDGDGKLDMAVLCFNKISILLNTSTNGTISFAPKEDITIASNARSLAIGDIDGDGKPEIVIAHDWNFMFSVIRNTSILGVVSFQPAVSFATNFNYKSVTIADIDGDKKLDVVTSDFSVRLNTSTIGQITFAPMTRIVDAVADKVITSDIDGDGKLDVIGNGAAVYRNNSREGTVTFERTLRYPTSIGGTSSIDVGDIDGDGKPDLILTNFSGGSTVTNTVEIRKNLSTNGVIHFAAAVSINTGRKPVALAVNDLDGDNKPDIITVNEDDNNLSVFRNADIVLPITLNKFTVVKQNNTALLQWTSAAEINAKQYEVENSFNGLRFNKIGTLQAKGMVSEYRFTDYHLPTNASTIYYRLKLVDKDGKFSYSEIRKVDFSSTKNTLLVYPNPVTNGILNIDLGETISKNEAYIITTIDGKIVQEGVINARQTSITIKSDFKGTYILKIANRQPIKIMIN